MRVVILGGSKFGTATAEKLIESGHEVVIIDKDRARLERLADRLDCGLIEGDGTLPTVLREAHSDENDVLIALTNASDDNILASVVARSVGYGRVIPQIVSSELLDVCRELELNDVITPHATVAESICHALEDDAEIEEETSLHHDLSLKRVTVPKGCPAETIADLELPQGCLPIARIRGKEECLATRDTAIAPDDQILFAVENDRSDALDDIFPEGA